MTYLPRKIDDYLQFWFDDPQANPLIVKGARQVGKTRSIREFAKKHYESVVEINFVEEPFYKTILESGYKTDAIIKSISRIDPTKSFLPGKTLLFFDELQTFPSIATALKFFKEDGRFDVICSGSLLGISYQEIESVSVGHKTDYEMFSMDFEEFLWARGYSFSIGSEMLAHLEQLEPFSTLDLGVFEEAFLDYVILGGMPAVVSRYVESGSFEGTLDLQKQIVADFKEDIRKYAVGLDKARVQNVFDSIPLQLAKENKKFQLSKVAKGARFKDYRGCLDWLEDAGMAALCRCLLYPELPLKGNYDASKAKVYFMDSGLFVSMLDEEASLDLRANKNLGVYRGALYESVVAEALRKSGYDLYYYKRENSTLELDFFERTNERLVPIEVKSKEGRAKSLRTLVDSDKYPDIGFGLKLGKSNIGLERGIYTFPLFTAFLVKRFLATNPTGRM